MGTANITTDGTTTTISLAGDLTDTTAIRAELAAGAAIIQGAATAIVVDLAGVTTFGAGGAGAVLRFHGVSKAASSAFGLGMSWSIPAGPVGNLVRLICGRCG